MCRKLALAATVVALALPAAAFAADAAPPAAAPIAVQAQDGPQKASAQERALAERLEPLARANFWNQQYQIDEMDFEAGIKLAASLRAIGQFDQASETAQRVMLLDAGNVEARLEFARARIAAGQAFYGIEALRTAQGLAPTDYRPLSLLGVAYEQVQRPDDALAAYQQALALAPNNPAVLSNLAMFYAAKGDTAQAETLLRQAVAQAGVTVQIRQNFALILGRNGKLAEAEKLLREDLPPDQANNNLAYLRAISGQAQR